MEIKLGAYTIRRSPFNLDKWWIEGPDGEGTEFDESDLAEWFERIM